MNAAPPDPVGELRAAVLEAAGGLGDAGAIASPSLERPSRDDHGDYSTNAAMLLAAGLNEQPREVAERLRERLSELLDGSVERIEVAGPGFLNLFLSDSWYRRAMGGVISAGERFGAGTAERAERVLVEFVSANPTGPLTAAGGRHAAYGDSLARILADAGHEVQREYYVNDVGGQVRRFAESLSARMRDAELPEDGYAGEYVVELGRRLASEGLAADDLKALEQRGAELILEGIRDTLGRFGVEFDNWFSERALHDGGGIADALGELERRGHVYQSEGATWLRTTAFGDEKDRVLVRSGGEPTYLASDIAYHRDKLARGFERLVDVLGADHHGHLPRMRAAIEALGSDPACLEMIVMQLVHVVEGGERAQMSKRQGEFVSLDELIEEIGVDAARFFMLQRSHDTAVDLDLELARRQSNENPVYYVQYAHARIASILRKAGDEAAGRALSAELETVAAPVEPAERALLKRILGLPDELGEAAERRAPHRLCAYAMAVAADFHAFYRDCKVIGAEGEGVEDARLAFCLAAKRTIARTLGLLGVSVPERM
jgi:arginyl-tRNA synthetase